MKTLILSSSLSAESRSFILCKQASDRLSKLGVEIIFVDARDLDIKPFHRGPTHDMQELAKKVKEADNIIFGMGVHCYSVNDSLKILLDGCFEDAEGKFFGILCAAGGEKSYLSIQHLTQICMHEWRMIPLPRSVYVTGKDYEEDELVNQDILERLDVFCTEFNNIGEKLLK